MIPAEQRPFTRFVCPDRDWPLEAQEAAGHLQLRDIDGPLGPMMQTLWEPTPDEIARINAGAKVVLTVLGTAHPHVALDVERGLAPICEDDLVRAA